MQVKVEKLPKGVAKLNIVVPNDKVKEAYDKVFAEVVKSAEIDGFRKGHAPAEMVKAKTDMSKLYGEVVNELLKSYYPQALKENKIEPISNPKVEIKEFDISKDFDFTATVAVKPNVKLGDYKIKLKEKFQEIVAKAKEKEPDKEPHVHITPNDIIDALVSVTEVEVADILKEEEADRMLTRLVDQMQAVGLSTEAYLKTQNKTAEDLRSEYLSIAETNLQAEFALNYLVKEENIEVSDKEIDDMINASGDEKVKAKFQNPVERLYIKSILAKNKLMEKLAEIAEGGKHEHDKHE